MSLLKTFKSERGAVDLGSVMTGVIILGITIGIVATTFLGVIPWMQNRSAQQSLQSIGMSQTSYKQGVGTYGSIKDLVQEKLIEASYDTGTNPTISNNGKLCSRVDPTGGYLASSKSASGKYYKITHNSSKPSQAKEYETCFVEDYAAFSMVFTIDTSIPNCSTYEFPASTLTNVKILWGDGTAAETATANNPTHTYTTAGEKVVKVSGQFLVYGKNGSTTNPCITAVKKWGGSNTTDARYAFQGTKNLREVVEIPSTVKLLANMFMGSTFNGDIGGWDTTNVTNMQYMFQNATNFNQDISSWNTSKVTTIAGMFNGATAFNQPIGGWDISNVTTLGSLFYNATSFNQELNNWNTSKVTNISSTFRGTKAFNRPLSNWKLPLLNNSANAFYSATAFNQDINNWSMGSVTTMTSMFNGATAFNKPLNKWNVSKVTDFSYMFNGAKLFNQNISAWVTSSAINMNYMFNGAKLFNQNISAWSQAGAPTSASFRTSSALSLANSPFKV